MSAFDPVDSICNSDGSLSELRFAERLLRVPVQSDGADQLATNEFGDQRTSAPDDVDTSSTRLTGAEVVALLLGQHGVRTVFAYAGTSELALCDAVEATASTELVNGRGDKESAFLAAGGSLLHPNRAAAVLHGARGLTNAAGAIADARRTEAGTLFVVGLPSTGSARFLPPHGEDDLLPAIGSFVDWWWQAPPPVPAEDDRGGHQAAASDFVSKFIEALTFSAAVPARPAMFGLPQDVAESRWIPVATVLDAAEDLAARSGADRGHDRTADAALADLRCAEKPVVLLDDYAFRYTGAEEAVDRLSRKIGAPVLQLRYRRGPMLFQRASQRTVGNFVGWYNQFSPRHTDLLDGADLLITVEDRNIYRRVVGSLPPCRKIAINGDAKKVRKNEYLDESDHLLEGNITDTMTALETALPDTGTPVWREVRSDSDVTPETAGEFVELHRTLLVSALAEVLGDWASPVLVDDSQMLGGLVAERYDLLPEGLRIFGGHGGFVGGGLAQATGLAISEPATRVMCLLGDQGFTNSFQGLVTAVQQQTRVIFIVCNNGRSISLNKQAWSTDPEWAEKRPRAYLENVSGLDYERIADALGLWTAKVDMPVGAADEMRRHRTVLLDTLNEASEQHQPALVELLMPSEPDAWRGIWITQGFEQPTPAEVRS